MKKILIIAILFGFFSCEKVEREEEVKEEEIAYTHHSDWSKSATIYELNIRQFSDKGDFNSIVPQLDRIKEMGIDIIWLMPIHPIGEKNRKGGLGSYYSVKDYKAVNPDYGTMDDFKNLVTEIHNRDMFVIIDWVANHTAWDCAWTTDHPDWYTKDSLGNLMPPEGTDWSDVVDLNYDNPELRIGMAEAMKFWVNEADIDGFRCDVADWVPLDFWQELRPQLDSIKPSIFMLAEAENPKHHPEAFDMSYGWELHHISNEIAKGEMTWQNLGEYMIKEDTNFAESAYRMAFTSNHDENSWNGTVFERYADNYKNWAVVMSTIDGMPLVYSGMESAMNERLEFFEKDTIKWNDYELSGFYKSLFDLKDNNEALWNGEFGGEFEMISMNHESEDILAYKRIKGDNEVIVMLNFSDNENSFKSEDITNAEYKTFGSEESMNLSDTSVFNLGAHSFAIYYK